MIGVNRGTKHLNRFLECSKASALTIISQASLTAVQEYESIGLLGAATTTMDSEGPILTTAAFDHITREDIEKVLDRFRGDIMQVPPM